MDSLPSARLVLTVPRLHSLHVGYFSERSDNRWFEAWTSSREVSVEHFILRTQAVRSPYLCAYQMLLLLKYG